MRDPVLAHERDLTPHGSEHAVGHLCRLDAIERLALDGLVGEHERVRLGGRERDQPRCANPDVARGQRHHRLVLDGPPQRRERTLVAEVAAVDHSVEPEEEVGAALVLAQRLDEEALTVGRLPEVRASSRVRRRSPASAPRAARRRPKARRRSPGRSGAARVPRGSRGSTLRRVHPHTRARVESKATADTRRWTTHIARATAQPNATSSPAQPRGCCGESGSERRDRAVGRPAARAGEGAEVVEIDDRSDRGGVNDLEQRHQSPGDHDRHDDCAESRRPPSRARVTMPTSTRAMAAKRVAITKVSRIHVGTAFSPLRRSWREPHEGVACEPVEQHQSERARRTRRPAAVGRTAIVRLGCRARPR